MHSLYLYGSEKPLPEPRMLHAGSLSVMYLDGNLRYIKIDDDEVIRMIYAAVRDNNWGTAEPVIENERIIDNTDSFRITYDCYYDYADIKYHGSFCFEGTKRSEIFCSFEGEALTDFLANRIGFCVLHPVKECAGKTCEIIHPDSTIERQKFPVLIGPHQPFMNIREMIWQTGNKGKARLVFDGEIFETEDQRNWTDASYKTYCRPLSLPFPFKVKKGHKIAQKILLKFTNNYQHPEKSSEEFSLSLPDPSVKYDLPEIGISQNSGYQPLSDRDISLLEKIPFSHYRTEVDFSHGNWPVRLENAIRESDKCGWHLELVLFFNDNPGVKVRQFSGFSKLNDYNIRYISILNSDAKTTKKKLIDEVIDLLHRSFPSSHIGAGTDFFFTELNREPPPADQVDYLFYSINPQVHAFDHRSLTETLDAQKHTVEMARAVARGKDIHISPVTLRIRKNPDATGPVKITTHGELPPDADVRQMSLFGAVWTLGCIKALAEARANLVTFYETTGIKGIMMGDASNPCPDIFRSDKGIVFPVYHVFHEVLSFRPDMIIPLKSSHTLHFDGMILVKNNNHLMIVWNYCNKELEINITDPIGKVILKRMNDTNIKDLLSNPAYWGKNTISSKIKSRIKLLPFEVIFMNW